MSSPSSTSVVLITSSVVELSRNFGTGFVIYQHEQTAYVLTCAHVVKEVGGEKFVEVDKHPAIIVASGEQQGFDLAVLQVQGLSDRPQLKLNAAGEKGREFVAWGFYEFDSKMNPVLRPIQGTLGESVELRSSDGCHRAVAWDLNLKESYLLRPGYSGAPVVDARTGSALGTVSHQVGKGNIGLAISVEVIEKIWTEVPAALLTDLQTSESSHLKPILDSSKPMPTHDPFREEKLKLIQKDIETIRKQEHYLSEDIEAIVSELEIIRATIDKRKLNRQKEQLESERNQVREKLKQLLEQQSQL